MTLVNSFVLFAVLSSAVTAFAPVVSPFASRATAVSVTSSSTSLHSRSSVDFCNEIDYSACIDEMAQLLDETKDKLARIKELADNIKTLEREDITLADLGDAPTASMLRKSVAEAKAAVDGYGPDSAQARLAWKDVDKASDEYLHHVKQEDIGDDTKWQTHPSYRYSAANLLAHHNYNAIVDSKILEDGIWSIDQLSALAHFVNVERARLVENADELHP
eukprot:CAMPEP_0178559372 /NCGR_PEP_ID=MMETSP0697-20121206/10909_1 /TAXON_ID=265572 /ORGANISM="Extubocellulus spinifer, Strain CCMP396" /LENGTH=218 /DNA_ID=CAMNT_0020192539 /DNA_START=19 /DNA_END=675 /DNA_ORIENTATION=-